MSAEIITFGCRLNAYESGKISTFAAELGITNCVIINTCAVTSEAERQLQQTIRRIYKNTPHKQIILTGCASQLHPEKYLAMPGVAAVISNKEKLIEASYERFGSGGCLDNSFVQTSPQAHEHEQQQSEKIRAFIQVQNGCNHCCSYCVITKARGKSISIAEDDVLRECESALANGYREICLTGVNISSYGVDIAQRPSLHLLCESLLRRLPELERLRISSLDPCDINDDFIAVFSENARIMPHMHLSIQSGDDTILKRMRRRHTSDDVLRICEKVRARRPETVFGADFITGFPSESDAMFENTVKLVQQAEIALLHVFPYSVRSGTSAASMPQIQAHIRRERARHLRNHGSKVLTRLFQRIISQNVAVRAIAEDEHSAKSDTFLNIRSEVPLTRGHVYEFVCNAYENDTLLSNHVIGGTD